MTAGSGMQQQQAFAPAQPAIPLQAPGSQAPQAAQAAQPPLPSHNQSGSKPAQSPWAGPPTSATAAPAAVQLPTASQTANPSPSGMTQPEGPMAGGPSMGAGQAGNHNDRGSAHKSSPHGDNAQQPMYSSNPNPGMGYSGGATPTHMINGLRPEQAHELNVSGVHETSSGTQVVHSTSVALAQPAQPGPTQSPSAATGASVNSTAAAAPGEGVSEKQQDLCGGGAAELLDKAHLHAPSGGLDQTRDATSNVVHQSESARGDVSEAGDTEDGLIQPQTLAGGVQAMSHNLLAD